MIEKINNTKEKYVKPSVCLYDLCMESPILQTSGDYEEGEKDNIGLFGNEINGFEQGGSFNISSW